MSNASQIYLRFIWQQKPKNQNKQMTYSVISCGLWGHGGQRSHRTGRYCYLRPLVIREVRWIRLVHDISATHGASPQSRKDIQKFWHSITEYANERDNVITNKQKCQSTISLFNCQLCESCKGNTACWAGCCLVSFLRLGYWILKLRQAPVMLDWVREAGETPLSPNVRVEFRDPERWLSRWSVYSVKCHECGRNLPNSRGIFQREWRFKQESGYSPISCLCRV